MQESELKDSDSESDLGNISDDECDERIPGEASGSGSKFVTVKITKKWSTEVYDVFDQGTPERIELVVHHNDNPEQDD